MNIIHDIFTYTLYQPLFNALVFLAWLIPGHSIGWAIIALTLIIRILLYPTSIKTLEHQRRLRVIQPKIDALKEKHGKDQAGHSKALMELYAAEKVSPFSSCLPMLVQVVVLGVIYNVFLKGLSTSEFHLLYSFVPHMDTINSQWFGLDLLKPEKWVMPLLAAGLQYVQAKQMAALTPAPKLAEGQVPDMAQAMTKQMTLITPVITYLITFRLPAALGLYWVATTAFMVVQQWWYMRQPLPALSNKIKGKNKVTVTIRAKGEKGALHE